MFLEQEKTANRTIKKRKESFFPFFGFFIPANISAVYAA